MFCAKDVCNALGYGNPQQAVRLHVENEDKGMLKISTPGGKQNPPTSTSPASMPSSSPPNPKVPYDSSIG